MTTFSELTPQQVAILKVLWNNSPDRTSVLDLEQSLSDQFKIKFQRQLILLRAMEFIEYECEPRQKTGSFTNTLHFSDIRLSGTFVKKMAANRKIQGLMD